MSYIVIRSQVSIALGEMVFAEKPVTVEGCTYDFVPSNKTVSFSPDEVVTQVQKSLHHVSFLYYTLIGSMVPTIIGYLSSILMGFIGSSSSEKHQVDPQLLAPFLQKYYQPSKANHVMEVIHEFETKDIQL